MPSTVPPDLVAVLTTVSPAELERILIDLLTPSEIASVNERWAIVKRLASGQTQRNVRDEVGVSVATVSRGARQLKFGTGGFAEAFATLGLLGHGDPREAT